MSKYDFKITNLFFDEKRKIPPKGAYLERILKLQLQKSKIDTSCRKLTPHSLRFTYVTRLRRFLPGETVQKIVGHTAIEQTNHYTKFSIPENIAALKNIIPLSNTIFD